MSIWNAKIHYRVNKNPTFVRVLITINTLSSDFFQINFNIILPYTCVSSHVVSSLRVIFFWIQLCTNAFPIPRISHAPSHPTSFYHPIVGLFFDKYYGASHYSVLLQPPVTTSILRPNSLLSTLFSNTPPAFFYNPFCFYHLMRVYSIHNV